MKITYSAPLAIPFSGENAALYGKPVLIAASSQRVFVSITNIEKDIELDPFILFIINEVKSYLKKKEISYSKSFVSFSISSDIQAQKSLSYKSATLVATTAALLEFYTGEKPTQETVNTLSYMVHKSFYKLSLGFFTSCSCFGGIQFYRKEFEFLKSVSKLNFKLPLNIQKKLYIVFSDKNNSTYESIDYVKRKYNANVKEVEGIFNEIEKNTKRIVVAIAQENEELFKTAFQKVKDLDNQLTEKSINDGVQLTFSSQKENGIPFVLSENGLDRVKD